MENVLEYFDELLMRNVDENMAVAESFISGDQDIKKIAAELIEFIDGLVTVH
jgi:hypothetical protein